MIDQKLAALGNEKADTTKAAYTDKDAINQIEFIKSSSLGEVLVVINQAAGIFVSTEAKRHASDTKSIDRMVCHKRSLSFFIRLASLRSTMIVVRSFYIRTSTLVHLVL